MDRERAIGAAVMILSIVGIAVYGLLLYTYPVVVLQLSIFAAVAVVLLIVAWIGWTMASTPSQPAVGKEPVGGSGAASKQEESGA